MKRTFAALLALIILLLIPLHSAYAFGTLLADTNRTRRAAAENSVTPNIAAYTPSFLGELGLLSRQQIDRLLTPADTRATTITAEQARDDVDLLFRMLKTSYGAYTYFGGDSTFNVSAHMADSAIEMAATDGMLSPEDLQAILMDTLSFVRDGHFTIGGQSLTKTAAPYQAEGVFFQRDGMRYYIEYGGMRYYADAALARQICPTIVEGGALGWGLFAQSEAAGLPGQEGTATLTDILGNTRQLALDWRAMDEDIGDNPGFRIDTRAGVQICSIGHMGADTTESADRLIAQLRNAALSMRGEAVAIIDLRGNRGGNTQYVNEWFLAYCGLSPQPACVFALKDAELYTAALGTLAGGQADAMLQLEKAVLSHSPGAWYIETLGSRWVPNQGIIFVLVDQQVASAAEWMVRCLRAMENVIVVGTNTRGCTLIFNNIDRYLPASGLPVSFGVGLYVDAEGNIDGTGIQPDIWVEPAQALEAVLALCNYYGLAN